MDFSKLLGSPLRTVRLEKGARGLGKGEKQNSFPAYFTELGFFFCWVGNPNGEGPSGSGLNIENRNSGESANNETTRLSSARPNERKPCQKKAVKGSKRGGSIKRLTPEAVIYSKPR